MLSTLKIPDVFFLLVNGLLQRINDFLFGLSGSLSRCVVAPEVVEDALGGMADGNITLIFDLFANVAYSGGFLCEQSLVDVGARHLVDSHFLDAVKNAL